MENQPPQPPQPPPPPLSPQRLVVPPSAVANPYSGDGRREGLGDGQGEAATVMPAVGSKLGPYVVQGAIGEGGSAAVFKVWHEELEVVRAVKALKMGHRADARERFFTEAKILADIRHRNIAEIYDLGYMEGGEPYLVLEYVGGTSVKELIAGERMPVAAALSVAYFVCQALHYAHLKSYTLYGKVYQGLIHRDVKPENILVSGDGGVKLMDFGIARPTEVSLHTVGGKVMGTLVYLSPEQLSGQTLDHRSDIFSLGAVLYEMVTGERAFPQKTLTELVQKKSAGQYRPLSSYAIKLPKRLAGVLDKSMRLDPADRYATAAEMAYDIYGVLREVSGLPPWDVLSAYMSDPKSIQDWTELPKIEEPEKPPRGGKAGWGMLPWAVAAAAGIMAVAGVVLLALIDY